MKGAVIIEGHIQGLSNTRSLGEIGIPVYVLDKADCVARYSRFCTKFFKCPDYISSEFVDFLITLAKEENIHDWVLFPSNDHAVISISRKKKELEIYYKVITPAIDIINKIYDKSRLLKIAASINIPIPKTVYYNSLNYNLKEDQMQFPVLTKGKYGLQFYKTFKRKAFLASNKTILDSQLKEIEKFYSLEHIFTQEVISYKNNKTVSFAAFCILGEIKTFWMGIKLREHPVKFGTATLSESIYLNDLELLSKKLIKELNYTGVCEIEYLKDPRDNLYKLIEINARTWLWVGLAKACGIDFAKMIYCYVNNLPFAYPAKYKTVIKWRNSFTDIVFTFIAVLKGVTNLKTVFKQNKGLIIDAIALKGDNKPFWAYLYLSISYIFRR